VVTRDPVGGLSLIVAVNARKRRAELRLRQREVAERAGIARTTLAVLEGERRRVTIDDLDALCVGLDCTLVDLLDGADRDVLRRFGLR
jgi:DNA-binding Xre family transcriptional regulator